MPALEENVRAHLRIEGNVQGVFFRASALEEANRLNLKGWVKNTPDGSVEVVAEGKRASIDQLVDWCRVGPPGAHVHKVNVDWEVFKKEFETFRIAR